MKCIAIDDELVALGIIRQFCQRSGDIELIPSPTLLKDYKR